MPTATMTLTSQDTATNSSSSIALKPAQPSPPAESSTAASLRSLYPRAAKAFLQRDIALTHSLLSSAFAQISPPAFAGGDELSIHRRKWDILRITLETTIYASPPTSEDPKAFPAALRANQMQSPPSLVTSFHTRSLQLFTPTMPPTRPSAFFLPHQILVTLILSSLKLGCPEVGRWIIEDWLARRVPDTSEITQEGYTKVLELYCMQILPRLEEWEYAEDFLQYERVLEPDLRNRMVETIRARHAEVAADKNIKAALRLQPSVVPPSPASSRSVSPAPSNSSDSSSSTQTATPLSPRPGVEKGKGKERARGTINGLTSLTSSSIMSTLAASSSTQSLASAETSRTVTPASAARNRSSHRNSKNRTRKEDGSVQNGDARMSHEKSIITLPRSTSSVRPPAVHAPSTLALVRSYIESTFRDASKSKITAFCLFFVVFPLLSLAFRVRRRRVTVGGGGTADEVRRRLRGVQTGPGVGGGLMRMWAETLRAVSDSVKMAGRGLV